MELEKIAGIPAHPLFVHVPVVLIPLAGIIALVFAFKPSWLDRFGWGLVALSGVGMIGGILAASSGEGLEDMMRENGEKISSSLREHAELGETARNVSILFFLVIAAVVVIRYVVRRGVLRANAVGRFAASKTGALAMALILAVSSVAATATVIAAGHDGAKQVWHEEYAED